VSNRPVAVSLGCECLQATPLIPKRTGFEQQQRAASQRIGRLTPEISNRALLRQLRRHVYLRCKKLLKPLHKDTDFSFENWLSHTNYTEKRKEELRKVHDKFPAVVTREYILHHRRCKCFIKNESYPMFKNPRGIASRKDQVKCWIGPIIKAIENEVYKLPYFIKHIPKPERAKYIVDHVTQPGATYAGTDYSSFESSFRPQIMKACEFVLYRYMTKSCPKQLEAIKIFEEICTGMNKMSYKDGTFWVKGRRMSGEMTTSLGNGWTNLMLASFAIRSARGECESLKIVVEGDDAVMAIFASDHICKDSFSVFGFCIKIEKSFRLSDASFCGLVFDEEDQMDCADPIQEIVNFGWYNGFQLYMKQEKLDSLLVAKAYSLLYEYPGCPIMKELAAMVFRCKSDIVKNFDFEDFLAKHCVNTWERDRFLAIRDGLSSKDRIRWMLSRPIGWRTRQMVERYYKISIDLQLRSEAYLRSITRIGPLDMPWLQHLFHPDQQWAGRLTQSFAAGTECSYIANFAFWK